MTIAFQYRCRRCGVVYHRKSFEDTPAADDAQTYLAGAVVGWEGVREVPDLLSVHACGEHKRGVSDLIGFEPVTTPSSDTRGALPTA